MLNRGEHVGRYEVETQIAVGGMATTYLARLVGEVSRPATRPSSNAPRASNAACR